MSTQTITPPEVGMGATYSIGSDCYPYTVMEVRSPKTIVVQEDKARPTKNHHPHGNQSFLFEPNSEGEKRVFTLRKNGGWYENGQPMGHGRLRVGERHKHIDPHF